MKKILVITSLYPNEMNPTRGIFVQKQVHELAKRNRLKVFSTENCKKNDFASYWENNIEVFQTRYSFTKFLFSPFFYKKAVKYNLAKIINDFRPDIIHIHAYQHLPELLILSKILNFNEYKIIVTFHNNKQIVEINSFQKNYYRITFKHALDKFDKIIVVSKKVRNIISRYTNKRAKIIIIGNGVETNSPEIDIEKLQDLIPSNPKRFNIISVGNLVRTKGFDLLIRAVSELNNENFKIDLTIIGDGPEKKILEELIIKNNMNSCIRLLGRVEHNLVMNIYKYYDAFVLPSWSETFGIVYLEAMLAKIPVLGVYGEGIDGIIVNEQNGLLCYPNDSESLKSQIIKLLESTISKNLGEKGFMTVVKNYRLESIIDLIEGFYER